jgi:hypothetical protein
MIIEDESSPTKPKTVNFNQVQKKANLDFRISCFLVVEQLP